MNDRVMSGLELVHRAAVCCTARRMGASQVAVLTAVALHPGCTSSMIWRWTGLSLAHVGNLLAYLRDAGDVEFTKEHGKDYKTLKKRWFLTAQGVKTVEEVLRGMGWGKRDRFKVVKVEESKWKL